MDVQEDRREKAGSEPTDFCKLLYVNGYIDNHLTQASSYIKTHTHTHSLLEIGCRIQHKEAVGLMLLFRMSTHQLGINYDRKNSPYEKLEHGSISSLNIT